VCIYTNTGYIVIQAKQFLMQIKHKSQKYKINFFSYKAFLNLYFDEFRL